MGRCLRSASSPFLLKIGILCNWKYRTVQQYSELRSIIKYASKLGVPYANSGSLIKAASRTVRLSAHRATPRPYQNLVHDCSERVQPCRPSCRSTACRDVAIEEPISALMAQFQSVLIINTQRSSFRCDSSIQLGPGKWYSRDHRTPWQCNQVDQPFVHQVGSTYRVITGPIADTDGKCHHTSSIRCFQRTTRWDGWRAATWGS